jgi:hypothetical protein
LTLLHLGKAPDEFYDEQVEKEKEFFDIIDTIEKKEDLQGMTVSKVSSCTNRVLLWIHIWFIFEYMYIYISIQILKPYI